MISTATPDNPSATPNNFPTVMRSSDNRAPAINIVNNGVVALMMDARPEEMWFCPHTISEKGIALPSNPKTKNVLHKLKDLGTS